MNAERIKGLVKDFIFASKWLLLPFYVKLMWTLIRFSWIACFGEVTNEHVMSVLEDVDIVMIANLIKMIITGSYHSFVDKTHGNESEQVSSGALKVKMATSILGVSAIHMLKTFIEAGGMTDVVYKQIWIHGAFIVGAIALALIDYLHEKTEHH